MYEIRRAEKQNACKEYPITNSAKKGGGDPLETQQTDLQESHPGWKRLRILDSYRNARGNAQGKVV